MEYKIGEVAKIIGITSQAIRFYESKGVINPIKCDDSNYRIFSTRDIDLLARTRILRSYGFSISEVVDILKEERLESIAIQYSEQKKKIEQKINWYKNILSRLEEEKEILMDTINLANTYSIKNRPAMYRFDKQRNVNSAKQKIIKKLTKEWIGMSPLNAGSIKIIKEDYLNGKETYTFGQVIDAKYKDYLNLKESEFVTYLEPVPCLYTIINFTSSSLFSNSLMDEAVSYLNSRGYELKDDIITRVSSFQNIDGVYVYYHQVWLPV